MDNELLENLRILAGKPRWVDTNLFTGHGFENQVARVTFEDGSAAVFREFPVGRPPETHRYRFLESHKVAAPALLAATPSGSLLEYIPGRTLGDLVESGEATNDTWQAVGRAFRLIHRVRFPPRLRGEVHPDRIELHSIDPVQHLHGQVEDAIPGITRRAPGTTSSVAKLHDLILLAAPLLQEAETALGHGDINLWNIIVDGSRATLIDWDSPRICDPALELGLLEKHASLFGLPDIPAAFFDGYGPVASLAHVGLQRLIQSVVWAASPVWETWATSETLPRDVAIRTGVWLSTLLAYIREMPRHTERVGRLLASTS